MENGSQLGRSLIKQLACCNKATRDRALRVLFKTWLPSQSQLPEDDMKKLWKGLFYCVWHADKLPVQADLIDRLSSLLLALDLGLSVQYFSAFLLSMRREWAGIDALRLDKFYLLIRRFVHKFFVLLKKNSWDLGLTQLLMDVLDESTFSSEDKLQGNGVNYHIASVFLEELTSFLPIRSEVLEVLFKPFISVMGKLPDKVLMGKIKSNMFDVLLRMGKRLLEVKKAGDEGDSGDSGDNIVVLGTIALIMEFSRKFYELGSSPECCQGNRKMLFALHEEFTKLEKDMASSGFEFFIPAVDDQDEEEVPNLVPIASNMEVDDPEGDLGHNEDVLEVSNGAAGKQLKKCKRDKKSSAGSGKKAKKKKKNDESKSTYKKGPTENENTIIVCENSSNDEQTNKESTITLNESVISNLQRQFEIVAAEAGLDDGIASVCDTAEATITGTVSKKRKRTKTFKGRQSQDPEGNGGDAEGIEVVKTGEGSKKKRQCTQERCTARSHQGDASLYQKAETEEGQEGHKGCFPICQTLEEIKISSCMISMMSRKSEGSLEGAKNLCHGDHTLYIWRGALGKRGTLGRLVAQDSVTDFPVLLILPVRIRSVFQRTILFWELVSSLVKYTSQLATQFLSFQLSITNKLSFYFLFYKLKIMLPIFF